MNHLLKTSRFSLFIIKPLLRLLLCLVCLFMVLFFSPLGIRLAIAMTHYLSEHNITFKNPSGSFYSGINCSEITVDNTLSIHQLTVNCTWTQGMCHLQAASLSANTAHLTLASNISADLTVSQPFANLVFHTADVDYRLQYASDPSTHSAHITLLSHGDTESLQMVLSPQIKRLTLSGSVVLPHHETFDFKPSWIDYSSTIPAGQISGKSRNTTSHIHFDASPPDLDQQTVSLLIQIPQGNLNASGSLGTQSQFSLTFFYDALSLFNNKIHDLLINMKLTGSITLPEIELDCQMGSLSFSDLTIDKLSSHYRLHSAHMPGEITVNTHSIRNVDTILLDTLSLHNTPNSTQFTFSGQQGPSKINGGFSVLQAQTGLQVIFDHAQFNQYALIEPENPQIVALDSSLILFSSENKNFSLNGSWSSSQNYDIDIAVNNLPTASIPLSFFNTFINYVESVDSVISLNVKAQKNHNQPSTLQGTTHIDIHSIVIHSLLDNLPLDSSIEVIGGHLDGTIDTSLNLTGILKSNTGDLHIQASSNLDFSNPKISLTGNQFSIGNRLSPIIFDADLTVTLDNSIANIQGDIVIKKAIYRLAFYQSASILPAEAVIHQSGNLEQKDTQKFQFSVNIDLGNATEIHAIGFHGKLTGKLGLHGSQSTNTLASGSLSLNHGSLVIYQQALPIDTLALSWFNSGISNPDVNLKIMTQGLRNIDGRDQMQRYGIRAYGALDNIRFDYISSPAYMNNFQILMALLTDSSFQKKSNTESLDETLAAYHYSKKNTQISELIDIINAIKSIPFFDNIDLSEMNFDEANDYTPELNNITLSKRLDKHFALRYRMAPYNQRFNRISLDTSLSQNFILTSFLQNEGEIGVAVNFADSY